MAATSKIPSLTRPKRCHRILELSNLLLDKILRFVVGQQIKDSCRASGRAATKSWVELNPLCTFGFSTGCWRLPAVRASKFSRCIPEMAQFGGRGGASWRFAVGHLWDAS